MIDISNCNGALYDYVYKKEKFFLDNLQFKKLVASFDISANQIKEFLELSLTLIKAPDDLQGIVEAGEVLIVLVRETLSASLIPSTDLNLVLAVLDAWLNILAEAPPQRLYCKEPPIEKSPFFAFYVRTWEVCNQKPTTSAFFLTFCLTFVEATKRVLSDKLKKGTFANYARAFRHFFKHMPETITSSKEHDTNDLEQLKVYINEAIRRYDQEENKNKKDELTDRAKVYLNLLINVLVDKKKSSPRDNPLRSFQFINTSEGVSNAEINTLDAADVKGELIDSKDDWMPEHFIVEAASGNRSSFTDEKEHPTDDSDEKVTGDFFFGTDNDSSLKVVPKLPRLNNFFSDRLTMEYYTFFWDCKWPGLYHHSMLLREIEESWPSAIPKDRACMLHSLIASRTGIAPELLLQMGTVNGVVDENAFEDYPLLIKKIGARFYIFKPAPVEYEKEPESGDTFRERSKITRVPLSAAFTLFIDESGLNHHAPGLFFSVKEPYKSAVLNIDDLKAFYKQINKKFELNLTVHNISLSFSSLYSSRYGLDEIKACYISGQNLRKFGSQLHYINFSPDELEREYFAAEKIVKKSIEKNVEILISKKMLPGYGEDAIRFKVEETPDRDKIELPSGYGSPFVPKTTAISSFVDTLKDRILDLSWREIILRHNLYMDYTYLCMQFSFAYRPRNEIPFPFKKFDNSDYLIVNDKLSARYHEERILPINSTFNTLIKNVHDGFEKVKNYVGRKISPPILRFSPPSLYFFLSERGQPIEFSLEGFRNHLAQAGIPYPFNMKSPRHYVRTFLYENGYCNDIADAILGHHRLAKEPLGISSSVVYKDFASQVLSIIDNLLMGIDITPIAYLPVGDDRF